jgi:hypothetical protein
MPASKGLTNFVKSSTLLSGKFMARGWASKSVESQIESVGSEIADNSKRSMPREVADMVRKKESLRRAKTYLQQQIHDSQHPRHRTMLESALVDLEKQITTLDALDRPVAAV